MTIQTILSLIIIGIVAGFLSGLVGVGGGIIMVPLLIYFFGITQQEAQGTSLAVLAIPVTALAAYNYYKSGELNINYVIVIAIFFILSSYFGSKLAISIDQKQLKKIFAIIIILVGSKMLFYDK